MKKTIAILLVAVLAVSSVFAGFSGKATVGIGANAETKEYGFTNGTGFDVNVDLTTAESEKVAEGSIYAGVKATLGVKVANKAGAKGIYLWDSADKGTYGAGLFLKVAEAYVAGENWKVSITGTQGSTSYAKSFTTHKEAVKDAFGNETTDTKDVADDVTDAYFSFNKAPGVTVEYAGFKASVGFNGSEDKNYKAKISVPETINGKYTGTTVKEEVTIGKFFNYNVLVETPSFEFDGLTLQAAVGASRKVDNYGDAAFTYGKTADGKILLIDAKPKFFDLAINTSAKVGYATDALSVAVAADYDAIKYFKDNDTIISYFDASAKVSYAPVTVDAYYAYNGWLGNKNKDLEAKYRLSAHTLNAQVVTDLASFDVPVTVTVWGKDVLNTMDYGAKAEATFDAIKVSVNGGYVIDPSLAKRNLNIDLGKYYIGADAEYKNELFTAKAGIGFNSFVGKNVKNAACLTASASVESDVVIPGATVKLAYGAATNDQNLLKDQLVKRNLGKAEATVTIKF